MPVVVQHAVSGEVLMLGYMTPEALDKTIESGNVTFFSRTKQRLWTKGRNIRPLPEGSPHCAGL
ncbi:bifunctional phosphoribosyl-AMP cyclohydrolase /phosphoribosyl-ATP pyrophosphatase protein [Citrobacter koseri]|uniref:phosphoribosyl-AMP cyclohydrolase n=1 Tax=Citrobacter koseri TaxID=545 RepID=A0A2X2VE87_CITKO|nr:bifunctional phosphoribosyl-AMP cyclohydrolase /phosphoribosyl-ATP pyrophosphatase protein [Citrobacter koseri]